MTEELEADMMLTSPTEEEIVELSRTPLDVLRERVESLEVLIEPLIVQHRTGK